MRIVKKESGFLSGGDRIAFKILQGVDASSFADRYDFASDAVQAFRAYHSAAVKRGGVDPNQVNWTEVFYKLAGINIPYTGR